MADESVQQINARLREMALFHGLSDADLAEAARCFTPETVPAGTAVFREGDAGGHFYLVARGQAETTLREATRRMLGQRRRSQAPPRRLRLLEPGDYFGAGALLTGRRRSATVTARTELELLRADATGFQRLLGLVTGLKTRLALDERTYRAVRRYRFDWQAADETILLFAQKHWVLLARGLARPVGVWLAISLVWLGAATVLNLWQWTTLWTVEAAVTLLMGLWGVLAYVDWSNDYYVITSKRVLHEERILLIYQARVEAPLYALRSVTVRREPLTQIINYGTVILQTFAGKIEFMGVSDPKALAAVAMEMVGREKTSAAISERKAIRSELLRQMGLGARPVPVEAAAPPAAKQRRRGASEALGAWWRSVRQVFSLQTRTDVGGIITYRKHPWTLVVESRIPLAILAVLALLTLIRVVGLSTGWLSFLPLNGLVCGVEAVVALPLLFWLYYRFEDWRNDIYQVTSDAILDIERKPFLGREERRQAPLEGMLNVEVKRPSLMANLLNYGDVIVQTGGTTGELTFDHVFDPLTIQQDLWRKFEMLQNSRREAEAARRRAEIAVWFAEFGKVLEDSPPVEK